MRPYVKDDVMMNASGHKKTNGTHIIVWRSVDAPENVRWRLIPVSTAPVSSNIRLMINGTEYFTDPAPYIKDGRTLVPMRQVFEILGATVNWNETERNVTAKKGLMEVKLTIDSAAAFVNGRPVTLDVPAEIMASTGRTMVPLRFVSEAFGGLVNWTEATRTITIENSI